MTVISAAVAGSGRLGGRLGDRLGDRGTDCLGGRTADFLGDRVGDRFGDRVGEGGSGMSGRAAFGERAAAGSSGCMDARRCCGGEPALSCASSEVMFSPTNGFDGVNYEFSQTSTGADTTDHEIRLIGLNAFTEYSFKVVSTDEFNIRGESRNYTFQTKATAPDIRNLRVVKVEENAATLAWDTNIPAKALIDYQDQTTGAQNSVGRPTLATTHQMRLADLTLGTRYVAFVTAENSGGDRIRSQPIQFITVRDIAPPIITNVTNESTLFPGSESRIQTIIEWSTDEPSACLMTYQEGVAGGTEPFTIEKEAIEYKTTHVEVVVDFAPATVYQFSLSCTDEAGNSVESENFVLFTPIQEKNIIDLILENFESTFGWVKNIGG